MGACGSIAVRVIEARACSAYLRFIRGMQIGAVALVVLLLWGGSLAFGAQKRTPAGSFGTLSSPQGVAIDQSSGDVYVADSGKARVEKFDALGNLVLGFGADVGGAGVDTCTTTCGPGTPGTAPGSFTTPGFLAVDNDPSSASFHDVYVADVADNTISKFNASGGLITSWGSGGQLNGSTTSPGSFGSIAGIAVDPSGNLLVLNTTSELFSFAQNGGLSSEVVLPRLTASHGLAVDGSGDLFKVNGDGSVEEMTAAGADIGTVTPDPEGSAPPTVVSAIAIEPSSGDLYATGKTTSGANILDHYSFNGSGEVIEPGDSACAVVLHVGCTATDSTNTPFEANGIDVSSSSGDSYLVSASEGKVFRYTPLVTVPDVVTDPATDVGVTTATANGTVNPDAIAVTSCEFMLLNDTTLRQLLGRNYQELIEAGFSPEFIFELLGLHELCEHPGAAEVGSGSDPVAVSSNLEALVSGTQYHYELTAGNANGSNSGSVQAFTTVTPPTISSAVVTHVTSSTADLTAAINPDNGGTTYRFEYGTTTSYGTSVPTPEGNIGAGSSSVPVLEAIAELHANVTYHWRVVASNVAGTTLSPDHTFIYSSGGEEGLPDGRAYEMVTPPQKNGSLIGESGGVGLQPDIAANGSRVIATAIQCFSNAESCNGQHGDGAGSPYSFTRTGGGWVATPLAPPATQFPANTPWGYVGDSGAALFSMSTPPFGEDDFYKREADGSYVDIGPITPPELGPLGPKGGKIEAAVQAETVDFSHFVWDTATDHDLWPFDAATTSETVLEYVGTGNSHPLLVGVSGGQGSTDLISSCATALGASFNESPPGYLSADGHTIYFTARAFNHVPCPGSGSNASKEVLAESLYARIDGELADAHTVPISQRSAGDCTNPACLASPPGDADFRGASEDGSLAYFTDTQQLTNDASADSEPQDTARGSGGCSNTTGPNGCNLYLYDFANPAGHELVDVSGGDTSGEGPKVQGVMAVSGDGSHVYFVAKGVLAANENAAGATAEAGADNLYVYVSDALHPTFIATLPSSDSEQWQITGERSNVTLDGRYLVFLSHGDLTPDDSSASGAQQVFRYDAQTGDLERISIGNDGFDDNGNRSAGTPCGSKGCSENASIARPSFIDAAYGRRDPTMSDNGEYVFFDSPVGLAPRALDDVRIGTDVNGNPAYAQNVYEWHAGHVDLISDGRDSTANSNSANECPGLAVGVAGEASVSSVCLLGTDANGADVFFTTADQLVPQDTDTELDIYDARICTTGEPCFEQTQSSASLCEGENCQGAPGPPLSQPTPASATLAGSGNAPPVASASKPKPKPKAVTRAQRLAKALSECRTKHGKRKRASCEAKARKQFGPVKTKKDGAKR
ncbi:MAG: hypothetical protein E7812_08715 [Phenylobacterium sp.]|nr:MAG: hypothetical protein E7812_08715 [Phenylobacterium sp.]